MVKKKRLVMILCIIIGVILVSTISAIKYQYENSPYPSYELPVMPFAYRAESGDIYVFDCNGNIYKISKSFEITDSFDWEEPTIQCLENGETANWLKKIGTTDLVVLQEKYNLFRDIVSNPEFSVFSKTNIIPQDIDYSYTKTTENWYGYISNTTGKDIYHEGYLEYDVTDKRAYEIVNWMNDVIRKCW